jgi:hypothetical protein
MKCGGKSYELAHMGACSSASIRRFNDLYLAYETPDPRTPDLSLMQTLYDSGIQAS